LGVIKFAGRGSPRHFLWKRAFEALVRRRVPFISEDSIIIEIYDAQRVLIKVCPRIISRVTRHF